MFVIGDFLCNEADTAIPYNRRKTEIQLPDIRRQAASVVREDNFGDNRRGFLLLPLLARRRVPQPDRVVIRPRGHRLAVRREGHRGDLPVVPFELLPLSAPSVRDAWHHVKVLP